MRRLLLLLPAVGLLAACTAPAPAPSTPAPLPATPSATVTPAVEPTPLPSEVARAVIADSTISSTTGDLPADTGYVYVHAACSGPAGSTMHYELRDREGTRFGPSADLVCDGAEGTAGSAGAGRRPAVVQVVVGASEGVTGWAVLTTSAKR